MKMTRRSIFVDTNVLLRATIHSFPNFDQVKAIVSACIEQNDALYISRQVVREYFNQVTRPQTFMQPMQPAEIPLQYHKLKAVFTIVDETERVGDRLIDLLQTHPIVGKQIHDANIVATMLVYDVKFLLTINYQDFKRFSDLITIMRVEI